MWSFSGDATLLVLLQYSLYVCEHGSDLNFTGGGLTIVD